MFVMHPRATAQLDQDLVGWLTTVNAVHQPQSSAVWFLRDGSDLIVYSRADAKRLINLATNPRVAFNLRGDSTGDTIVTLEGTAVVDPRAPTLPAAGDFTAKYGHEMARHGWTPEQYHREFAVALRIAVTRIRSW